MPKGARTNDAILRDGLTAFYPRLWRFALMLSGTRANADDLAQKACTRALENADKFDPDSHLDRWLFTLTRRLWLNELRADAVRRGNGLIAVEDAALISETLSPETNIFSAEVFNAVGTLPESQRETVMLV